MKVCSMIGMVLVGVGAAETAASDFWFTASPELSAPGPATLTHIACGPAGTTLDLTLWARTDLNATLRNVSLNLDSTVASVIDFSAATIENEDPATGGDRFQFVQDSSMRAVSTPLVITSSPDGIENLQAFTVSGSYSGLNPTNADDASLALPAWRLATVSAQLTGTGTTQLQLSVGDNGINNDGGTVAGHTAVFYDVALTVRDVLGDFTGDSAVNSADVAVWEANFGDLHSQDCSGGDADGDGDVDGADYIRLQGELSGIPVSPAAAPVPEPATIWLTACVLLWSLTRHRRSAGERWRELVSASTRAAWQTGVCLAVIGLTTTPQIADAQQFADWVAQDGTWDDAGNWNPQVVPNIQFLFDSARIANGETATIDSPVFDIRALNIADGRLLITQNQSLNVLDAALVQQFGSLLLGQNATLGASMDLLIDGGRLAGHGKVEGNVINGGLTAPGGPQNPYGTLTVQGNYRQDPGGVLEIQVAGSGDEGQFDRLVVEGEGELGGRLVLDLTEAALQPGLLLQLLSFRDGFDGQFASYQMISSDFGKCFVIDAVDFTLQTDQCYDSGDMNLDGLVDSGDLQLFALALADKNAYRDTMLTDHSVYVDVVCVGDVSLNGLFDFDDISAFAGTAGLATATVVEAVVAAQQAIPEPTAAGLAIAAYVCLAMRRRSAPGRT